MYNMSKCPKCKSTNISEGTLSGPVTLGLNGLLEWLEELKAYTCNECGYTTLVNMPKIKGKLVAR